MSKIRILNLCHKKSILVDIYRQFLLSETISSRIGKAMSYLLWLWSWETMTDAFKATKLHENYQTHLKSDFLRWSSERWHMMEKIPILIFRPELPYSE